jgi:hypothetical protein
MGARDVLHELRGAGLSVQLIDGRIIVTPKERLTDPLRDAIRAHRDDLVLVLKPDVPGATTPTPTARIYRLTRSQADEAHALPWSADTIRAFGLRRDALLRHAYGNDDAHDLAELLALRDARGDDRRMCVECTHLGDRGRCLAAAAGRLPGADRRLEPVQTILMRCMAFGLRKGLT